MGHAVYQALLMHPAGAHTCVRAKYYMYIYISKISKMIYSCTRESALAINRQLMFEMI